MGGAAAEPTHHIRRRKMLIGLTESTGLAVFVAARDVYRVSALSIDSESREVTQSTVYTRQGDKIICYGSPEKIANKVNNVLGSERTLSWENFVNIS